MRERERGADRRFQLLAFAPQTHEEKKSPNVILLTHRMLLYPLDAGRPFIKIETTPLKPKPGQMKQTNTSETKNQSNDVIHSYRRGVDTIPLPQRFGRVCNR